MLSTTRHTVVINHPSFTITDQYWSKMGQTIENQGKWGKILKIIKYEALIGFLTG